MNQRLPSLIRKHRFLILGSLILCSIATFRAQFSFVLVVGESMYPTFRTGDLLLISKRAFQRTEVSRGDIVVAQYRGEAIVKRIVGLPGEEVQIKSGELYVNSALRTEEHRANRGPTKLEVATGKLLDGKFALLGDNRDAPGTQLVHAVVPKSRILGKVVWSICWPRREQQPAMKCASL